MGDVALDLFSEQMETDNDFPIEIESEPTIPPKEVSGVKLFLNELKKWIVNSNVARMTVNSLLKVVKL